MNRPLRFVLIMSLIYSIGSTTRCSIIEGRYFRAQKNVTNTAELINNVTSDFSKFRESVDSMTTADTVRGVVYRTITRTVTKIVYVKVPVVNTIPKRIMEIRRDSTSNLSDTGEVNGPIEETMVTRGPF